MNISSYTYLRNGCEMGYPFKESIASMLSFSDEVVVVDAGSTDETLRVLKEEFGGNKRVNIVENPQTLDNPRFAPKLDGEQKAFSRKQCNGDVLFQFDCDEIVSNQDKDVMIDCCYHVFNFNKPYVYCLPLIEFWGSRGKIRCDIPFYKPRISINLDEITHGIPIDSILIDKDGNTYSKNSDGCDYIFTEVGGRVPYSFKFINTIFESARLSYFNGNINKETFLYFLKNNFNQSFGLDIPVIYHYSWNSLSQKIANYKNYWSLHWSSMFDEKVSEQNFFFNKPWSDVTDEEITEMANKLEDIAGWIFHKPIDFEEASRYPHINIKETNLTPPCQI